MVAAVIAAAWVGGLVAGITAVIVTFVLNGLIFFDLASGVATVDRVELWRQILCGIIAIGLVVLVRSRHALDRLAERSTRRRPCRRRSRRAMPGWS